MIPPVDGTTPCGPRFGIEFLAEGKGHLVEVASDPNIRRAPALEAFDAVEKGVVPRPLGLGLAAVEPLFGPFGRKYDRRHGYRISGSSSPNTRSVYAIISGQVLSSPVLLV